MEAGWADQRAPKAIVSNEPNDRLLNSVPYLSEPNVEAEAETEVAEAEPVISTIEATEANSEEATTITEVVEDTTVAASTSTTQPQPQSAEPTHRKVSTLPSLPFLIELLHKEFICFFS